MATQAQLPAPTFTEIQIDRLAVPVGMRIVRARDRLATIYFGEAFPTADPNTIHICWEFEATVIIRVISDPNTGEDMLAYRFPESDTWIERRGFQEESNTWWKRLRDNRGELCYSEQCERITALL